MNKLDLFALLESGDPEFSSNVMIANNRCDKKYNIPEDLMDV